MFESERDEVTCSAHNEFVVVFMLEGLNISSVIYGVLIKDLGFHYIKKNSLLVTSIKKPFSFLFVFFTPLLLNRLLDLLPVACM